jgi:hypothetical protein
MYATNHDFLLNPGLRTRRESRMSSLVSCKRSGVDFIKLKRGEREYAQLLDQLRKADPEAFERRK